MKTRIDTFVDWFVRSDMVANQFGSNDDWLSDPERMERCERAAEDGGDGSTHAEVIDDWRQAFKHWVRYGRTGRNSMSAGYDRFETAVLLHFDRLEDWHKANGSLHQEIG